MGGFLVRDEPDGLTLMRVTVLTTSYPRHHGDSAGRFVFDTVENLRAAGVDVTVVSPVVFRHYGLAYGDGIPNNIRRRPWLVLAIPLFLISFAAAARRAARDADLVHAHWLPSAFSALATRKPMVVQLWGSDAELARRIPWAFRPLVRRAGAVVVASTALAAQARALGAANVHVVPSGVALLDDVGPPAEPPHALYVGRLSEEKGVRDLVVATAGLPLVVVGDGPLRALLPQTVGFVPPSELGRYYDQAAVVVVPSRREGYGVVCAEAMAHGRPVVASAVGGLLDLVDDGVTGLLVPPGDPDALRIAIDKLLGDPELRAAMGNAARRKAEAKLGWATATAAMLQIYREVVA